MSANKEISSGLLVMGMSNTVFFGEGVVHELVLVDLASGKDFSLPISEEQAQVIFGHMQGLPSEEDNASVPEADNGAETNAWNVTETTPQL